MLKAFYSAPDYKSLRDAEQRKRFALCDLLACVRIYMFPFLRIRFVFCR